MVVAYLLNREHEVTVFEANDYVGGHTHTIDVARNGRRWGVDTGFIVFNEKNYPNFVKLLKKLGVLWQPSSMGFSVQCAKTGLEFCPTSLNALFSQRRNLIRPSFYRMLADIYRFRRESQELLQTDNYELTMQAYLQKKGYSKIFSDHFIIPMGEAIWSADPSRFQEFPVRYFVEFFNNHGFLNINNKPIWNVIKGGSSQYIKPLTQGYQERIRTNCAVAAIRRHPDSVVLKAKNGTTETFDQVVIAAHSDQALKMLEDPSDAEHEVLSQIRYQENETVLHTDTSVLPSRRRAWASWNYFIPPEDLGRVALTYDMSILQSLNASEEFCVSLNMSDQIDPAKVIRQMTYHHPVYTPTCLAARRRQPEINGRQRTYFCGAYWGYGFHEDGVNSALEVAKHFGQRL
jgi:predicted NAD/FAD-binding protein